MIKLLFLIKQKWMVIYNPKLPKINTFNSINATFLLKINLDLYLFHDIQFFLEMPVLVDNSRWCCGQSQTHFLVLV